MKDYRRINMTTAFNEYKNEDGQIATLKVLDICEFTSKAGKDFCIIRVEGTDIACTDLIYKQLREQPILWTEIDEITIISLTSKSTGRNYFMISKYVTKDGVCVGLTSNESYKDVVEYLNEYIENADDYNEAKGVSVIVDDVIVKEKFDDGAKYKMFTLGLGNKVNLKLTVRMNKDLTRIDEYHNLSQLYKVVFKCIGGVWKVAKVVLK